MRVVRAERTGYCFGVRRAVRLAQEEAARSPGEIVWTIGPLMHNPQEVARLRTEGIAVCDDPSEIRSGRVLVRSHGIPREIEQELVKKGVQVVDSTCPHVLAPRLRIQQYGRQGRTVVLAGDPSHPEVQAQISYAVGPILVASRISDLAGLRRDTPFGVVAQTTLDAGLFAEIVAAIKNKSSDVEVSESICTETQNRRAEAVQLAARTDCTIVVGGRNSANTRLLASLCRSVQARTHHVETASELVDLDLGDVEETALLSGASTPDWILDEVQRALEGL